MGTFFHRLKDNKTGEFPRNWCFVDTETTEIIIDDDTKKQVLRLGTAIYKRDSVAKKKSIENLWEFKTVETFWDKIIDQSESDRRLVVMAYNVGFDARILNMFDYLPKIGYELQNIFDKGQVFICSWSRGKHKITVLDAMNYFTGKLSDWGEMLGYPKGKVDFATVNDFDLIEYCKVDTKILYKIWMKWREFVDVHDLGCFCPTKSSQALSAFRHRFMDVNIYIHANKRATKIERDSYYGGRTEGFRLGVIPGGPFYKLDVNSMFPHIMRKLAIPVKYLRTINSCSLKELRILVKRHAIVAEVTIKTDLPVYPFRTKTGLIYPTGTFNMTLAGPELAFALKRGHIKKIGNLVLYDAAIAFKRYILELYELRKQYIADGNKIFEQLVKFLMNCLYGKFGQRNEVWKVTERETTQDDGVYFYPAESLGVGKTFRVVSGTVFELTGTRDALHSFHAISSYITSAARIYLWEIIEKAGREHVFYCDTDAVIVDKRGYKNLQCMIDKTELGKLKIEEVTNELTIYAPKDYKTDKKETIKGISSQAEKISEGNYQYWQWQGIRGSIRSDTKDCVMMLRRKKTLRRECTKGIVQRSGIVVPFVLSGETALSR